MESDLEEEQREKLKAIVLVMSSLLMTGASISNIFIDSNTCKIDNKSLKQLLRSKEVKKYTTMDEELKQGNLKYNNISLIEQDELNRKDADKLRFINKLKDKKKYLKTLKKLKYNSKNTEENMLTNSVKCSIANELNVNMNDLKINSDNNVVPSYQVENKTTNDKYKIRFNSAIYIAISRAYKLHKNKIPHNSARDIAKSYNDTVSVVENVLKQATSRQDDELVDKYNLSHVKTKNKQ